MLYRDSVLSFQDMLHRRAVDELAAWLGRARESGVPCLATFARGIEADRTAVEAAFSRSWSNGPTEGNVNYLKSLKLKFLKRQGYGWAGFDLPRRRVRPPAA